MVDNSRVWQKNTYGSSSLENLKDVLLFFGLVSRKGKPLIVIYVMIFQSVFVEAKISRCVLRDGPIVKHRHCFYIILLFACSAA